MHLGIKASEDFSRPHTQSDQLDGDIALQPLHFSAMIDFAKAIFAKAIFAKTTFADEGENLVARDIHVRIVQIGRHVIRQIQLSRSQKMFH